VAIIAGQSGKIRRKIGLLPSFHQDSDTALQLDELIHMTREEMPMSRYGYLALAAGLLVSPAAHATIVAKNCGAVSKISVVFSDEHQTGTSQTFAPIAGTLINFKQRTAGCVIISFSAEVAAPNSGQMAVRAVMDDGAILPVDDQVDFTRSYMEVRSYDFLFLDVPAGDHSAFMQWAAGIVGKPAYIDRYTMVLRRR
jgi:hypothetical protein